MVAKPIRRDNRASRKLAAPFACHLVIMAKEPVAGRVKSRLARVLGVGEATRFYRATAAQVMARLGHQPFWRTTIAIAPDRGVASRMLPRTLARMAQGGGDLGQRLARPMRHLPPGPVCIVGTDIPEIGVGDVRRAFRLLGRHQAVFGPASDGGFWLVGLRPSARRLLLYGNVRWSTSHTLGDVLSNLAGRSVATTTMLSDVDEAEDLARLAGRWSRRIQPG